MYIIFLNKCGIDKCAHVVIFAASIRPRLKKRYHTHVERVRDYLESVKDFDELISPQSLFLHFLGPEPSSKIRKNIKIVKKSKYTDSLLSSLSLFFFLVGIIVSFFSFPIMTTRFSKAKLAEVQEKKAKASLTSGLLTRKCQRDVEPPKDNPMVTSPVAKSVSQRPTSPTSSLELIASTNDSSKAKGKDKTPTGSF